MESSALNVVWERPLGDVQLGTFVLTFFAWEFSFEIFCLGISVWDPSLRNFRLEDRNPEAGGTGLLRLGEPHGVTQGNHRAMAVFTVLHGNRVRTLLGKPS